MENIVINGREFILLDTDMDRNSGGRLEKVWIKSKIDGSEYLVKTSTQLVLEPYSEVMAYKLGVALGFPVVEYWLTDIKPFKKHKNIDYMYSYKIKHKGTVKQKAVTQHLIP